MKIGDMLKERNGFSFEVFPPKNEEGIAALEQTLDELYKLNPDFVSVTYGAGGTNKGTAFEIGKKIQASGHDELMHFTCIGNTEPEVDKGIQEFVDFGIQSTLLLRGDLPKDWDGPGGDFEHATDLIKYVKSKKPELSILGAACPETHPTAVSPEDDIKWIKVKQDMGADALTSQLCYDVRGFTEFREKLHDAGVTIPLIAGVMPVLKREACIKMTLSNGSSIPKELAAVLGKYPEDNDDFRKAGIEYTIGLVQRYIESGVEGIHIFSLNKADAVTEIVNALGSDLTKYRAPR
jgi:methylenetetrahydrofolate reductase (NADPH)